MTPTSGTVFSRQQLAGPAQEVAPDLLGARLRCRSDEGEVIARVVEVEAYGPDDPASHSVRGPTPRCRSMFAIAGTAYVYRSHGVHWCLNVAVDAPGIGAAVLLRAAEVEAGETLVRRRRPHVSASTALLRGPGCLTQGLGVAQEDDGRDLCDPSATLRLEPGDRQVGEVVHGPRVGVSRAADRPWRFFLAGSPAVSRYRRARNTTGPDGRH